MPTALLGDSRILIDGDRFRTESPEAIHEGEFHVDVESSPCTIDIDFVEGPEAGQTSRGIFTLDGDQLTICVGLTGAPRPTAFRTTPGSRHALETLHRTGAARPVGVTGGKTPAAEGHLPKAPGAATVGAPVVDFLPTPCALDAELAGEWAPLELVRDGKALPVAYLAAGRRVASGDEVRVIFGGQTMVRARVRYDDRTMPAQVDYLLLDGQARGQVTHGICTWDGQELHLNMAPPGGARPSDWSCDAGSGRVFSRWKRR